VPSLFITKISEFVSTELLPVATHDPYVLVAATCRGKHRLAAIRRQDRRHVFAGTARQLTQLGAVEARHEQLGAADTVALEHDETIAGDVRIRVLHG